MDYYIFHRKKIEFNLSPFLAYSSIIILINFSMQLTIISGENVASLEVASDIELENFLALCSVELTPIANTQFDKLLITYNGRQMTPNEAALKKKLQVF
jgi:hypothetical protein